MTIHNPAHASQLPPAHPAKSDAVLKLLDQEIARLEGAVQRAGYTPWAIVVAAAGLIWTLLSTIPAQPAGGFYLLAACAGIAAVDAFSRLRAAIPIRTGRVSRVRFQQIRAVVAHSDRWLFYSFLRSAVIAALWICTYWLYPLHRFLIGAGVYASWAIAGGLSWSFRLPDRSLYFVHHTRKGRLRTVIACLLCASVALNAIALSGAVAVLQQLPAPLLNGVVRVGLIAAALVTLTDWYVAPATIRSLLNTLISIRRDFGLGALTDEQLCEQVDETLNGATVTQLLKEDLTRIRDAVAPLEAAIATLVAENERFAQVIAVYDPESREATLRLPADQKPVDDAAKVAIPLIRVFQEAVAAYRARSQLLVEIAPEVEEETATLEQKITIFTEKVSATYSAALHGMAENSRAFVAKAGLALSPEQAQLLEKKSFPPLLSQ